MEYFHETIRAPEQFLAWVYLQQENHITDVKKHWHRSIEMSYMIRGTCLFSVNGKEFAASSDDLIMINSCDVHGVKTNYHSESDMLCIIFPYSFLKTAFPDFGKYRYEPALFPSAAEKLKQQFREVYPVFAKREQNPLYQLKLDGFFYEILYTLFTECRIQRPVSASIKSEKYIVRCTKFMDYIDQHYMDDISLESMANTFSLSKEHLSRTFKSYMDTTFKKYLTSVRLHHAYQQLMDSDLSILEIALRNGFSDSRAFSAAFQSFYGMTPLKYRKSAETDSYSHQKRKYLRTHGFL